MIGITMGDPNGVGPEIAVRTASEGKMPPNAVIYGDIDVLTVAAKSIGVEINLRSVASPDDLPERGVGAAGGHTPASDAAGSTGARGLVTTRELPVVDMGLVARDQLTPGRVSDLGGAAAVDYVARATQDAIDGRLSAICTLPVNKEASRRTRPDFTGHTEFIAQMCGDPPVTMMLASESLVVTHVSTHVSMTEAVRRVTTDRVLEVIRLTHAAVTRLRPQARIAVAGLNPHAGEHGAFGGEDDLAIAPAIATARAEGIDVTGPEPGDTVFYNAVKRNRFDAVVCMYHDQGHIPMKTLDFDGGVNVTLGLPIVRTSVDHGTAYDIAYQGIAHTRSFELALKMATNLGG